MSLLSFEDRKTENDSLYSCIELMEPEKVFMQRDNSVKNEYRYLIK